MNDPARQAAPQPEVEPDAVELDDEFTVELPSVAGDRVRLEALLRGDRVAFTTAFDAFVEAGSAGAAPLFVPAELRDQRAVREVLDALGGATVVDIRPVA